MPSRTDTTYPHTSQPIKVSWSDAISKPKDVWGLPSTTATTPAKIESTSAMSQPLPSPQTSWDIQNPEADAQSRKFFGIATTNAIPAEHETSLEWCMKRKEEILALQSSKRLTKVFALKCNYCNRYFKHCMFSKAERRIDNDNQACRWCQADGDEYYDRNQWEVHHHIHCNKPGKKVCKAWCSLTPPPAVQGNYHWTEKTAVTLETHVPTHYLKHAFLVGNIPFRSLQSDPRVSYKLYIPPSHLNPNPRDPSNTQQLLPLLVTIHGTSRKVSELVESLIPFAQEKRCAVLAPMFPMGIDGVDDVDSYKVLKSRTLRSDLAVLDMLDEISHRWPGISTDKIFLCGYSGGGQFVHRFMYLYPERLYAVSVGAPGRTTLLSRDLDWPGGIQNTNEIFGREIDLAGITSIPNIQLVVGENDDSVYGGNGFWEWLEGMKRKMGGANGDACENRDGDVRERNGSMGAQKEGRLQTAVKLHQGWAELGIQTRLDIVPGVAHDWRGVQGVLLEFLRPLVAARTR
ncbi:hypothetical protein BKA64DRAFT_773473 [Cadophora sp. MPI-SDFR-AT-0126]|nr:hypothetical protein BKA64DRAFT_773473 [Leotiomycetes sp. MPI-SDFR-AT-0126]